MKKTNYLKFLCCCLILCAVTSINSAQKKSNSKITVKPKPVIFAVLNDGQTLEPIGEIDKGKLVATANGGDEPSKVASFAKNYYKPKTTYNLIFGGVKTGTVTVKSNNPESDCSKNLADITVQSSKAKLKGFVMGLATTEEPPKFLSGLRRMPTYAERTEVESLVRAELVKQKVSANAVKSLKSYNLTALDVDNDGKAELVGSYYVNSSTKEKNELFFIAEMDKSNKYKFGFSNYIKITPDDVMSGELKDVDELGGELLLDTLEYEGKQTAAIFTITKAFEGNNYTVYNRRDGKWAKVFEGYNYHCAF